VARATSSILPRRSGCGNGTTRSVSSALQVGLPPTVTAAFVTTNPDPSCTSVAVIDSSWPGVTKERSFASLTAARSAMRSNFVAAMASQPEVCAIVSMSSTPGISGKPGKCPSKMVFSWGTWASALIVRPARSRSTIRSISWKYSMRIGSRGRAGPSGPLRCDETVDAGAQVLQHEILFRGGLTFLDFLSPLLERKLDSECLVDGECDVEKVEAVDAEIVDRVTLRLDLLARDVARLGDDIGDRVEG